MMNLRFKRCYVLISRLICLGFIAFILGGCGEQNASSQNEGQDVINVTEESNIETDSSTENTTNDDKKDETASRDINNENIESHYVDGNDITYAELHEGDGAPNFEAELTSGDKFVLSDNVGKVVLINFWATWCGPCVGEMPAFERLYKEYGDELKIVCVNCIERKSDVDDFVKSNGYSFPIAYDEKGEINSRYPTQGIPYTLVICKNGIIKNIFLGSEGEEEQYQKYKAAIDAALSE